MKISDSQMTFVHEQENNRPEKGSLMDFAKNFQKQVQVKDTAQENEIETNTAPIIANKKIGPHILQFTWIRSNSHSNLPQTPSVPIFFNVVNKLCFIETVCVVSKLLAYLF